MMFQYHHKSSYFVTGCSEMSEEILALVKVGMKWNLTLLSTFLLLIIL